MQTMLWQYLRSKLQPKPQNRDRLKSWQQKQVTRFLQKIVPKSPFYQCYYQGHALEDWQQFPTIDKQLMMEQFNQLNTRNIDKEQAYQLALTAEKSRDFTPKIGDISVGLSSGTSGNRGLFLVSDDERQRWAGVMLAKILPDPLWVKQRVALFLRANNNLYTSVDREPIRLRFFDMLQPIETHVQDLQTYQPTILVAPPSYLRFLAEEILRGKLQLQPRKVISVAEVLDPLDQTMISEAFGQTIHQIYQCTEGFLGITCEYGTLHLNEDMVAIQKEVLDKQTGKFSPIITDFSRVTQPIIRYRLNDILTESKTACPCGLPHLAIEQIEGRCDDMLALPALGADQSIMIFPDFIRRALITANAKIEEYLVIQHSEEQLEISIKTDTEMLEQAKQDVVQAIDQLCSTMKCKTPQLLFTAYSRKPNITKLRRVERRFLLPERVRE